MEEPRIIARMPDGRALYRVGTFDKRILALEIESHLRPGGVQTWEFQPSPWNALAASVSPQTDQVENYRSNFASYSNIEVGRQNFPTRQINREYCSCI